MSPPQVPLLAAWETACQVPLALSRYRDCTGGTTPTCFTALLPSLPPCPQLTADAVLESLTLHPLPPNPLASCI